MLEPCLFQPCFHVAGDASKIRENTLGLLGPRYHDIQWHTVTYDDVISYGVTSYDIGCYETRRDETRRDIMTWHGISGHEMTSCYIIALNIS